MRNLILALFTERPTWAGPACATDEVAAGRLYWQSKVDKFREICGHSGRGVLSFTPDSSRGLETFVDSNWATRFSCSGCMVFYHGCLFHWFSKMQRSITLSSAEAEYFGAMLCARDLIWIRDLLVDLGIDLSGPSVIRSDSRSAVGMALDPIAFKKTKHILRAAEFLRDLVAREVVTLEHVSGLIMLADLLTKPVACISCLCVCLTSSVRLVSHAPSVWYPPGVRLGGAIPGHMRCMLFRNGQTWVVLV